MRVSFRWDVTSAACGPCGSPVNQKCSGRPPQPAGWPPSAHPGPWGSRSPAPASLWAGNKEKRWGGRKISGHVGLNRAKTVGREGTWRDRVGLSNIHTRHSDISTSDFGRYNYRYASAKRQRPYWEIWKQFSLFTLTGQHHYCFDYRGPHWCVSYHELPCDSDTFCQTRGPACHFIWASRAWRV